MVPVCVLLSAATPLGAQLACAPWVAAALNSRLSVTPKRSLPRRQPKKFEQGDKSMRYLPMVLGAGLLSAGLLAGSCPAAAMPTLALDRSAVADTSVEKAGYYYRRGYRPYYGYGYRRPYYGYGYRRPYYGYGYRRPYYGYGYGRRWRY
jgi:hypothetical protein